ncbi:MAG: protein translocase subunit SecD [Candidatus Omnitrophica bacterium]|nr:protein translocase subunit SecD [Candidatus Omnitrophota bacterium]MDE2008823.1 protein translocase subunit SecD [Candidatus Omnitrophota bacterium]MDE2213614.1 protein translocase subunit SecD [Candidatus Omnitrophota bacterium]MDE2230485.1 protein translocase subunit SecD [Candidatus Omnitrophota bacterium]
MSKELRKRSIIIIAVIAGCVVSLIPINKRINLGLDLKGGMHLVLRVDNQNLPTAQEKEDAVLRSMEVLRNRIDGLGVGETLIQRQGNNQILLQLPGVTDRQKALAMIGRVARLEFHMVDPDEGHLKAALNGKVPAGEELMTIKKEGGTPILIYKTVAMGGQNIKDARVDISQNGMQPKITMSFNEKGAKEFGDLTTAHVGDRLAIVLDNQVLSAPVIREPILTGDAEITGDFKFEEASLLALALRTGALPVPMTIEEERTIGPLLGKDSIEAGVKATILGGVAIVFFMCLYYFIGGFIASAALAINLLMILGSMGLLNILLPQSQVTLTLPGIAGIILTLGMAVDANVLINERIREELDNGRPLTASVNTGYARAWSAILDSHVTSLIAAFFLFQFGSGPIKGFAITLSTGLVASLFSSIYVTRTFFNWLISQRHIKSLPMMHLFRNPHFNFLNKKYICFALSAGIIIWGAVDFAHKKDAAFGIDFAGGQIQEYKFAHPVTADKLRALLKEGRVADAVIQTFPHVPDDVIIRTPQDSDVAVAKLFKSKMPDNPYQILRIEKVGPVVGQALRIKAIWAIALALGGMLIYIGFRFKHYTFGLATVVAIFHDVLITLSLILIAGRQIDLLVVTAILTITGYSTNDAIIIYDRVRENVPKMRNKPLADVINESINQTLGRTVLTTFMTTLSALALFFFGGEVLNTFAFVLIRGFLFGTYSTVWIVSPLFLWLQGKKKW